MPTGQPMGDVRDMETCPANCVDETGYAVGAGYGGAKRGDLDSGVTGRSRFDATPDNLKDA